MDGLPAASTPTPPLSGDLESRLDASENRARQLEQGLDRAREVTQALRTQLKNQKEDAANAYARLLAELEEARREIRPKRRQLFVVNPDEKDASTEPLFGEASGQPSTPNCECNELRVQLGEREEELYHIKDEFASHIRMTRTLRSQLQEAQRSFEQAVSRHQYELRETQMRAQGASDRLYLANYQSGEVQERLSMAEQALSMYESDITDFQARVRSLEDTVTERDATIAARDAQIRILQFSLDQRVRAAMLSGDEPGIDIAGPATTEHWSGLYPRGGPSISAVPSVFDSSSEAGGLDSSSEAGTLDAVSQVGDDDDVRTVLSASTDLGSFSDVSGPPSSFAPGTPRSGSPRAMLSDEDWSELGGTDAEGGFSTDDDPFSGASTPARAPSPPATVSPPSEPEAMLADDANVPDADARLTSTIVINPNDAINPFHNLDFEGQAAHVGIWEDEGASESEGMVLAE